MDDPSATLAKLIANLDPEVRAAIEDVDRTLIQLSLEQSPWNRLRSASRMAQALGKFRDGLSGIALLAKLCDAEVEFIVVGGASDRDARRTREDPIASIHYVT